jgi:hypothetical protein
MTDDRDVDPLREFRADLADPTPDRQVRIRARITGQGAGARPSPRAGRPKGMLVPAVAATAVLAVVAGAGYVAFDGSGGGTPAARQSPASGTGQPAPDQPVAPPSAKTSSTPVPPSPAEHQAAVSLLEQFAASAGSGPAPITVPDGQLLYVSGTGSATNTTVGAGGQSSSSTQAYKHEMWVEPAGNIVVMIRRTDGDDSFVVPDPGDPMDNHEDEVERARAEYEGTGPTFRQPSPQFLAALPTDPRVLLERIRTTAVDSGGSWSADHAIMDLMRQFLYINEPLITPQVRAALYRALATLGSISSTGQPITVDGRSVYAIGQSERESRQELLVDAQTGRIVGGRTLDGQQSEPSFYDLWTHGVVAEPGALP